MQSLGMHLIASAVDSADIKAVRKIDPAKLKDSETKILEFIQEFIFNHGEIPGGDTVYLETGKKLPKSPEPFSYYEQKVHERFLSNIISKMMMKVQNQLSATDVMQAAQTLLDSAAELAFLNQQDGLFDFRFIEKLILEDYYTKKKHHEYIGIKSGWPHLDTMMGALEGGDVLSIVGRPAAGKTFLLLSMAHQAWLNQEKTPLVVTPEMKPPKLIQRLVAMHIHKNLTHIVTGQLSTKTYETLKVELVSLAGMPRPFYIVDGKDVPTIEDLFLLCRQLKPDAVYYDGAYLMKHRDKRMGKWERIAETAIGLKDVSTELNLPVTCSYQFNKEVVKKSKKKNASPDDIGLEDIYGSDEIGQLSSVVLGMLQPDSVKTIKEREVSILKGRSGETGLFKINWNFNVMDFSEIEKVDPDKAAKEAAIAGPPPMKV